MSFSVAGEGCLARARNADVVCSARPELQRSWANDDLIDNGL